MSSKPTGQGKYVVVDMHESDLMSLVDLLKSDVDFFNKVALTSLKNGDETSHDIFLARAKLTNVFYESLSNRLQANDLEGRVLN